VGSLWSPADPWEWLVVDRRAVGGVAAAVAVAALGWAATFGPLAATPIPAPTRPQMAAAASQVTATSRGADLFQASCAACHGQNGEGTANGPSLTQAGAAAADFMLRTGRMPLPEPGQPVRRGTPVFGEDDIQALVAYVASLGQGPPIPGVQVNAATDIAAGRAAYVATCAACHGAGGSGDAVGGGQVAPPLLDTPPTQVGEAIRIGPGAMPAFDARQITDPELSQIAAYLQFLKTGASPGGATVANVGPVAEGYVGWLVYLVVLVGITRWIERSRRHQ
jgi:ubiquinol-cytochrome c reductase cytochrome c subunit